MKLTPQLRRRLKLPGRSKYGNRKTIGLDGIKFDSRRESRRWSELRRLEDAGEIEGLKRQVPFKITINNVKVCTYIADFQYAQWKPFANGERVRLIVVEDAKGFKTAIYRLKKKLVKAVYGIDIQEV